MLNTAELTACPVLTEPGNYHFEGCCEDCDVATLARLNLGQVDDRYRVGRVTQDEFEAYMHVWAVLSPTRSQGAWRETPSDPAVRRIARKLLRARGVAVPAELGEPSEWRAAA